MLLIRSRWYCRSCCFACEPRPERDCVATDRGPRGEGGGIGGKFAGWYLGRPARLRLFADALALWLLLVEGEGTDIFGERGEEGV